MDIGRVGMGKSAWSFCCHVHVSKSRAKEKKGRIKLQLDKPFISAIEGRWQILSFPGEREKESLQAEKRLVDAKQTLPASLKQGGSSVVNFT